MSPIELYPALKHLHLSLVAASGTLFTLRGGAAIGNQAWPTRRPWRLLRLAIDTLLLVAGASLWARLRLNPARDTWLGMKLVLLVVYIVVGSVALKRGRTRAVRTTAWVGALMLYLFIASVALAHDPRGILALLRD